MDTDDAVFSELANSPAASMTSVRERNRQRKRLQRERQRTPDIVYETEDWELFLDRATLPQKAGCRSDMLAALVLRELVDNALDTGAAVSLCHDPEAKTWIVSDDGPGIDPDKLPTRYHA
jgi:hypothetical protein